MDRRQQRRKQSHLTVQRGDILPGGCVGFSWEDGADTSRLPDIHLPLTGTGHMAHRAVRGAGSQRLPLLWKEEH